MVDLRRRRKVRTDENSIVELEQNKFARRRAVSAQNWLRAADFEPEETMAIGQYVGVTQANSGMTYYILEDESGEKYHVRANKTLQAAMEKVEINSWVEVVYMGSIVLESGKWAGKDCHQFEVYLVDDPGGETPTETLKPKTQVKKKAVIDDLGVEEEEEEEDSGDCEEEDEEGLTWE